MPGDKAVGMSQLVTKSRGTEPCDPRWGLSRAGFLDALHPASGPIFQTVRATMSLGPPLSLENTDETRQPETRLFHHQSKMKRFDFSFSSLSQRVIHKKTNNSPSKPYLIKTFEPSHFPSKIKTGLSQLVQHKTNCNPFYAANLTPPRQSGPVVLFLGRQSRSGKVQPQIPGV